MLRTLAFLVALTLLVGCDTAEPDLADTNDFSLRLDGALQTDFYGTGSRTEAAARLRKHPEEDVTFVLLWLGASRQEGEEESAGVKVSFRIEGELIPGRYQFEWDDPIRSNVGLSYSLDRGDDFSARYQFRGEAMNLEIVRVDDRYLAGRLNLRTVQIDGQRLLYGQHERVELAGPVRVSAAFEAEIVE